MSASSNNWQINDAVYVDRKSKSTPTLEGIIVHLGPVQFANGDNWVGVRLTGLSIGSGTNNGTVKGKQYFVCTKKNEGIFVRASVLRQKTRPFSRKKNRKEERAVANGSVSASATASASATSITDYEVRGLFTLWNDALATLDPSKVARMYGKKAVLLPTVSDIPRTDFESIKDYFTHFLQHEPQGEILDGHITVGHNWAQDCGIYEFTMGTTGKKVKGRYSFIYVYEDDEWKIGHHHSSVMPEGVVTPEPITEDEVRSLFDLWNDALTTLDPTKVADRYSKNGVLLPTVSDIPRTDYPGIVDYFTHFLKMEPQGEILDGNIIVGTNWAQDAGVYEFTMGTTGAKVKGRYTYVYIFEDGEWKISQHHSSVMPESNQPQAITEEGVKDLFQLWNSALATLDPDAVARRYAKKAVLLPTVSDVPRTDYDLIRHYFEGFLKKEPQGEILESHVTIGHNWCQDLGIYEFTMGVSGDKVKGRYSFVYVWEDQEWKISHHHSSVMPEPLLGPAPKP